jgi:hypothetical protein
MCQHCVRTAELLNFETELGNHTLSHVTSGFILA